MSVVDCACPPTLQERYRRFSEIKTTLRIWATLIILQNNYWKIWTTLDLLLVAVSQNIENYYSALSVFS